MIKRISSFVVLCSVFVTFSLLISSCVSTDAYDPNALKEDAKKAFPTTIGSNQDWNMVGSTTFNIGVNEDNGKTYTIKVLDKDPIGNSSAKLLATGTVVNGSSVSMKFSYPLADSTLYISRVDSKSRREVVPVSPAKSGSTSYTFGSASTKTKATTRAIGDFIDPAIDGTIGQPYSEKQLTDYMSSSTAIQITDGMDVANYLIKNMYETFFISSSISTINNTLSGDFTGKRIIVANGGTWTLSNNASIKNGVEVIVANGGTIDLNGYTLTSLNTTASGYAFIIMPGGKIINGELDSNVSGGGSLYNGGTLNLTKMYWSSGGNIINANGASLETSNLSLLTHATLINHSENCHIVNTNNDTDNANYENSCKIIIDGSFTPSSLSISNGASIQCKDMTLHGSTVNLGNDAILKATNTTHLQSVTVNGPTSGDHAICVFSTIPTDNEYSPAIFNNLLYVDITSHPAVSSGSWWGDNTQFNNGAIEVGTNEADESIPSGDCSIGYNPVNQGGDTTTPSYQFTYAFEDMMKEVGDYDFNDVVLKVSAVVNSKVYVELVAGGATKNLYVHLKEGSTVYNLFGGKEIHDAFGVSKGVMINTDKGATASPVTETINITDAYDGDFYITDDYGLEVHIPRFTSGFKSGDAPYALCVPCDWEWPKESIKISDAYSDFDSWSNDATKDVDWYSKDIVSDKVMN